MTAAAAPGVALNYALAQLGTPYRWRGDGPADGGFDCSDLVQAAYRAAGINLPRVARAQYDATAHLALDASLRSGDMLFCGGDRTRSTRVGLDAGMADGHSVMVDAPHTGANVRIETAAIVPGRWWGAERYLGATTP